MDASNTHHIRSTLEIDHDKSTLCLPSIKFPLPNQTDLQLCRDAFLEQILPKPKEKKHNEVEKVKAEVVYQTEDTKSQTAEGMAILNLIKKDQFQPETMDDKSNASSFTYEEKCLLFLKYNYTLQSASIEYVLVNMLTKVYLCSAMWPGDINTIPNKLFAWSVDHFLRRANANTTYLDVIKRNYSRDVLDCYKFKIDCHELSVLIESILDDVRRGHDVCKHSMKRIKTSYYDEYSEWLPECSNVRDEREQLLNEMRTLNRQLEMIDEHIKMYRLLSRNSLMEILDPIESRYRFRWVHDAMEQILQHTDMKNKALQDELTQMQNTSDTDEHRFQFTSNVYNAQIEEYKYLITEWEEKYDKDYEDAELVCNVTQNSLQKIRDDEKFYHEQMEFFIRRIAEVREEIRLEEEETMQRNIERFLAAPTKMGKQNKNKNKNKKDAKKSKKT